VSLVKGMEIIVQGNLKNGLILARFKEMKGQKMGLGITPCCRKFFKMLRCSKGEIRVNLLQMEELWVAKDVPFLQK
jgi:hypothetical protein